MRKIAPLFGAIISVMMTSFLITASAESNQGPQLIVEGNPVASDVAPKLIDGRTFVPIRAIASNFNSQVGWDDEQHKVTVQGDSVQLSMQIGNKKAVLNGKEVAMDVSPIIDGGRTLVPLRFVGESLGTTVGWEQETQTVIVNKPCTVNLGSVTLNSDIYKLSGELYIPLKKVAEIEGITYPGGGDEQKLSIQGKTFDLDKDGRKVWKLRRIGSGWYIPLSVAGQQFQQQQQPQVDNQPVDPNVPQLLSILADKNKITVSTTKPITPNIFTLSGPFRVVIDLPNTLISSDMKNSKDFSSGLGVLSLNSDAKTTINQLRFSQYDPTTVRVVLELNQKAKYTLNTTTNGFELTFQPLPPKTGYLVVLDAGHGGKDTGAIGISGDYEKDITLSVEKLVKAELLKNKNFQVVETRMDDTYPTLQDRVQIAQNADADLFLSIHCNSFDPDARGTETYYYTPQSEQLAQTVHKHLVAATGFPDRGAKTSGFYVIKNTTMPSNLVELGFITNAIEDKQLLTPEVQQRIAKALADAILEYYNANK